MNRATFRVDYTIVKGASRSRQSQFITQSQLPNNGTSQFAVASFLQTKNPGAQIEINSMVEV